MVTYPRPVRDVRRVILVVEAPFTARDAERFGVADLQAAGLMVQVWEVFPITLPQAGGQVHGRAEGVSVTRFDALEDFRQACADLTVQDAVIALLGRRGASLRRCLPVLEPLAGSAALWFAASGRAPMEAEMPDVHNRAFERRGSAIALLMRRADVSARTLLRRSAQRMRELGGRSGLAGLRELDIAWVATSAAEFDPALVGPRTNVRPVHAFDLDRLGGEQLLDTDVAASSIVYVDGLGPLHPDIDTLSMQLPLPTMVDYFGRLTDAFEWLEAQSGIPVTIAAHPRAPRDGSLEPWYGDRRVVYGSTAREIEQSRLVLMSHPSDALAIVIALEKPVLVLRSGRQEAYEAALCRGLRRFLRAGELWAERPPRSFSWPTPDATRYRQVRERYLKRADAPDGRYWQIVARDLTSLSPARSGEVTS